MAKSKFSENLIKLRCAECKRTNYYTRKNKKTNQEKLEVKKYCPWCREHAKHTETKK
ncbi:MAG: 50S ribosomal protein L33 [Candidatus Pacebacteria bacterium]|nr:50S ribosomal protein L33 [Candidatus Paceibacterota bacterium]